MPLIKSFGSFRVLMFFEDHNPPHVHVTAADFEAQVAIASGQILEGDVPAKFRRAALDWIAEHKVELMQNWEELH